VTPKTASERHDPTATVVPDQVPDQVHWYKDAVIYEVHVRAFQDSDGDGIGDFKGLIARLDYLQDLGVTALWLLPFYPSPLRDDGYDISDYRRVNPSYGTLRDFKEFLRKAHSRGLRVITELVLAHTSDEHPWFQRARRAAPGSPARDFYVWSDTPDRYSEARIIFKDFETSNWTWDPVAGAYFWHRFYSHQPALNYDNPEVQAAVTDVLDFWLEMGVDGLRLDAVPYLYAREGTSCENLPETFAFLRKLRAHVDERFEDRMLLAEANQWPEDAVAYLGDGDVCHMAFHFPLMPRMFMAARQEDRFPIVDILQETPPTPPDCQWALFLRNHDELTLEMVTDEERDYMYRTYAQEPQARVNAGIRRRLAPLLGNDRQMIEMMNGLLLSLPGTPILYYGDEIGMGDNYYLGDRNAVRTPMQWGSDRNAGFSRGNPQQLYLPVIIDPQYRPQAVNVEAQSESPSSLLWWMKRVIALRKRYRAFGRGSLQLLLPDNRKVLAFLRVFENERILVVVNLSRYAQAVELDLAEYSNTVPVELFGGSEFPAVGDLPYFITLGPHGFYWFSLERHDETSWAPRPALEVTDQWEKVLVGASLRRLEEVLPAYIADRRWFREKARRIKSVRVAEVVPVSESRRSGPAPARLALTQIELDVGHPETYFLPLAYATGIRADELVRFHPEAVIAVMRAGGEDGVLYDAAWDPDFARALLDLIRRRRQLPGRSGRLAGLPTPTLRRLHAELPAELEPQPIAAEQTNSSIAFGDHLMMKLVRRVEEGPNPGVELGRFLAERARFPHAPAVGGSLEYRPDRPGAAAATLVTVEEYAANECDGWTYVVDALRHGLEEALARHEPDEARRRTHRGILAAAEHAGAEPDHPLLRPHETWAALLGQRTAELHLALASDRSDPDFAPEPLTSMDRQAMYHGARSLLKHTVRQIRPLARSVPAVQAVVDRSEEILEQLRVLTTTRVAVERIRCHGDYHLGQVLWTGKDFVLIDFEGEPARSVGQRRLKRPALVDVAGMIRSFHYASRAAAAQMTRDLPSSSAPEVLDPLLELWYPSVAGMFLRSYLETAAGAPFVPADHDQLANLLGFHLLEKAIYELGYEANSRPEWVAMPAQGILDLLETNL